MVIQQSMARKFSFFYHAFAAIQPANLSDFFNTHALYQQPQLFSGVVNFFYATLGCDRRRMDIDLQEQPFWSGRDPDWVYEGWRFTAG